MLHALLSRHLAGPHAGSCEQWQIATNLGAPGKSEAATADCMEAMSVLLPGAPRSGGACPSAISICLAAASGSQVGYVAAKLSRLFSILPCRLRDACTACLTRLAWAFAAANHARMKGDVRLQTPSFPEAMRSECSLWGGL